MRWIVVFLTLLAVCGFASPADVEKEQICEYVTKADAFLVTAQLVSNALQKNLRAEPEDVLKALDQYNNLPNRNATVPLPKLMSRLGLVYTGIELVNQGTQMLMRPDIRDDPAQVAACHANIEDQIAMVAHSIKEAREEIISLRRIHGVEASR